MNGECSFDQKFFTSTHSLSANDVKRVLKAVDQYLKNPESPSLNLEPVSGKVGAQRLWTIRASQEIRILLARQGSLTVFLRAGRHDDIYLLAGRTVFVAPRDGAPALIGITSEGGGFEHLLQDDETPPRGAVESVERAIRDPEVRLERAPRRLPRVESVEGAIRDREESGERAGERTEPSLLEHWTDKEIAELGFAPEEVALLRQSKADNLLDVWPEISEDQLDIVLQCCEISPEEWREQELLADEELANERFRTAVVERGAVAGLSDVLNPDEILRLLKAPVEEWMVFLHPEQRSLVRRRFSGPARISGSAGTGKTVVALHRAAALAKRFSEEMFSEQTPQTPILFTTYIKNLPPVLKNLYLRLPSAMKDAVEFTNVDKLAYRICKEAGREPSMDPRALNSLFSKAHKTVVTDGSPLHRASITRKYLREEIDKVIKGMGIDTLEQYLAIERTGRQTPFGAEMRRQSWELKEEYDRRLAEEGIVDFPDVLRAACDIAKGREAPTYRAAIVDEAQDLTLVGLQFVYALVTGEDFRGGPDSLLIVGDGAQKIYPGGFTLAQAGIDVRGNSSILRENYRNTEQIIKAALACAGAETVDDLGDEYKRGEGVSETQRQGVKPQLIGAGDISSQASFAIEKIEALCEGDSVSRGDIGVFAAANHVVNVVKSQLKNAGFLYQDLQKFAGKTNRKVKVGTFHRAKGLEFKVVFILGLTEGKFPSGRRFGQSQAEHAENRSMQISQLFVAMTRARDALFLLYDSEPSEVLYSALEHCELVDDEGGTDKQSGCSDPF